MQTHRLQPNLLLIAVVLAVPSLAQQRLTGRVKVNGSSTVAPIMMAAAELFQGEQPRVEVPVGISGTGGGFEKFFAPQEPLRTDINDASRPIKPSEISRAATVGVEFIELPIAYDGIAVAVHPENDFCDHLTVEELKRIWRPGSKITNWSQVRAGFPDLPLKLYGPGTDSGTFDYFTEVITGESGASRADYTASEDDNVLVKGVSGDKGSLGYFGFAYYEANAKRLKLLGIAKNGDPVRPTVETIRTGTYDPLSRPLFVYVNARSARRAEVQAFVSFVLSRARVIVEHPKVNYVALADELYELVRARFEQRVTGSAYATSSAEHAGATARGLADLYGPLSDE